MLFSDEPTVELLRRARGGDREAVEAILQRCLPNVKRWAHGRLPHSARGYLDTGDLVQEAAIGAIGRLDTFEPRHVGAMQAFLRQCVMNRIRDEVRRVTRRPAVVALDEDVQSQTSSPQELAQSNETYERYRVALSTLKARDRQLVIARVEAEWTVNEIADHFGFPTVSAARMAVSRARKRLDAAMRLTSQ